VLKLNVKLRCQKVKVNFEECKKKEVWQECNDFDEDIIKKIYICRNNV
jgi:hypothetical protein